MLSLTPTKLRDYMTCPMQYKLRHVDKISANINSSALAFGRSLHAALDELHRQEKAKWPAVDLDKLLTHHWENDFANECESKMYFDRGYEALQRYVDEMTPSSEQTLGTEVYMTHVINVRGLRVKLGCKADRVSLYLGGLLEVVDYKTNSSGKLPTSESLSCDLPTFLYYLLARITYPEFNPVKITFLNVITMAKVGVEYNQLQIAANKKAFISVAQEVAMSNFGARPCEACAWCAFQDHCPLFSTEVNLDALV